MIRASYDIRKPSRQTYVCWLGNRLAQTGVGLQLKRSFCRGHSFSPTQTRATVQQLLKQSLVISGKVRESREPCDRELRPLVCGAHYHRACIDSSQFFKGWRVLREASEGERLRRGR